MLATTLRAQRRNLIIGTLVGALDARQDLGADPRAFRDRPGYRPGGEPVALGQPRGGRRRVPGSFTALRRFYAFREARSTETWLRERLFGHIMSLHIGYHDRAQTGQLMSRSSSDLKQIQGFVVMIPITLSNSR